MISNYMKYKLSLACESTVVQLYWAMKTLQFLGMFLFHIFCLEHLELHYKSPAFQPHNVYSFYCKSWLILYFIFIPFFYVLQIQTYEYKNVRISVIFCIRLAFMKWISSGCNNLLLFVSSRKSPCTVLRYYI